VIVADPAWKSYCTAISPIKELAALADMIPTILVGIG
jgi:hypothetical protein